MFIISYRFSPVTVPTSFLTIIFAINHHLIISFTINHLFYQYISPCLSLELLLPKPPHHQSPSVATRYCCNGNLNDLLLRCGRPGLGEGLVRRLLAEAASGGSPALWPRRRWQQYACAMLPRPVSFRCPAFKSFIPVIVTTVALAQQKHFLATPAAGKRVCSDQPPARATMVLKKSRNLWTNGIMVILQTAELQKKSETVQHLSMLSQDWRYTNGQNWSDIIRIGKCYPTRLGPGHPFWHG